MSVQSVRLRPKPKPELGDYQLDAIAVEYYEDSGKFDFRFELGSGLGIYWALPVERNARLRLPRGRRSAGELKTFRDGTKLLGVMLKARSEPAWYRCKIAVQDKDRKERTESFEWPAPHDTDARQ